MTASKESVYNFGEPLLWAPIIVMQDIYMRYAELVNQKENKTSYVLQL